MKTATFFAAAMIVCPGLAAAAPAPAPAVVVHYADLDLARPAGARTMLIRIRKAAADACRDSPGMAGHDSHTLQRLDDCYRQSVRRAVEGLNAPLVTAAYQPAAGARQVARLP
jgi:UrcA family protein